MATVLYALRAPRRVQGVPWTLDCPCQLHLVVIDLNQESISSRDQLPGVADAGVAGTRGGLSLRGLPAGQGLLWSCPHIAVAAHTWHSSQSGELGSCILHTLENRGLVLS